MSDNQLWSLNGHFAICTNLNAIHGIHFKTATGHYTHCITEVAVYRRRVSSSLYGRVQRGGLIKLLMSYQSLLWRNRYLDKFNDLRPPFYTFPLQLQLCITLSLAASHSCAVGIVSLSRTAVAIELLSWLTYWVLYAILRCTTTWCVRKIGYSTALKMHTSKWLGKMANSSLQL